jgi:hypothetical protein
MDLFEKIDLFEKMATGLLADDSEVIDTLEESKYATLLAKVEQFSKQADEG